MAILNRQSSIVNPKSLCAYLLYFLSSILFITCPPMPYGDYMTENTIQCTKLFGRNQPLYAWQAGL
jgi:hypothetical protein